MTVSTLPAHGVARKETVFILYFKVTMCTLRLLRGDMGESTSVSEFKMRSFQENLSIFTDNTTNLLIQISELNELREQLRQAQLRSNRCGGKECELNVQHIREDG